MIQRHKDRKHLVGVFENRRREFSRLALFVELFQKLLFLLFGQLPLYLHDRLFHFFFLTH